MNGPDVALYYLGNSRSPEQTSEMIRLEASQTCIFCPEQSHSSEDRPWVLRTAHWTVRHNRYPYKGTKHHLLIVPDEHVIDMADLSGAARDDFWVALERTRDHFGLTHYGLGVRNGDCRYTGGTIAHLHVHVLVGDTDDPSHEPVRIKVSSRPTS